MPSFAPAVGERALALCQALVRIDTTNPPGQERAAADLLAGELADAGLEPRVLESAPGRANVVARLRGTGELPPLLLCAHLDVVAADPARWSRPPFSGELHDGCLWGRGAVDMKNMAAMCVAVLGALARDHVTLRRDVIFAGVADEEAGCELGSTWLVAHHPELVRAEYALGEVGGFNVVLGGRVLYPVQIAEKGICWVRARVRGEPGHGSMPRADSAVVRLSAALARLGTTPLPRHRTAAVDAFLEEVARAQPWPFGLLLGRVLRPGLVARALALVPDRAIGRAIGAMLSNTATPTVLRAGDRTNVVPGAAEAEIDGRTLPGQTADDLVRELAAVLGPDVELEVIRAAAAVETVPVRSPLYDTIAAVIRRREPRAAVVPYLMPGGTDAKAFANLGTRWYGFAPVKFPAGMRFADLYHGDDERIPVDGLRWGAEVLRDVVVGFCR